MHLTILVLVHKMRIIRRDNPHNSHYRVGPVSHFNITMLSYQYMHFHSDDKMVSRPSYIDNDSSYSWRDGIYIKIVLILFRETRST